MSIRRTKEEKLEAQLRRVEQMSYQLPEINHDLSQARPSFTKETDQFFAYDISLIKQDLLRTLLATVVVCGVLVALSLWL